MRSVLAWVITLVWVALYARKVADPSFPVPAEVTPVMLLAAGYLLGQDVHKKLRARVSDALKDDERDAEINKGRGHEPSE